MKQGQEQVKNKINVVRGLPNILFYFTSFLQPFTFHPPADFKDGQFTKNYFSQSETSSSPSSPSLSSPPSSGRKLLDIYGDSLKHVNRLLNVRYGRPSEVRKVPAHMPHFVQTEVMEDLQSSFVMGRGGR